MRIEMRLMTWPLAPIFLLLAPVLSANPVVFDTQSYNFALDGGGGGEQALLGSQSVETFCVDFNNEIWVPGNYTAYLSTLTNGSDLSNTRFGSNTSWETITLSDGNPDDATDSAIINDADALGRYQMAAFLITQYQTGQGSNAYNNGIQAAIWDILDPSSYGSAPNYANPDAALELAAAWYGNPDSNTSFLSNFVIISDPSMTSGGPGNPLQGGFQEQLAELPEPREIAWVPAGLLVLGVFSVRLARQSWVRQS
jgi:hypothetical protein